MKPLKILALLLIPALLAFGAGACVAETASETELPTPESADIPPVAALRTIVDRDNRDDYDFTEKALAYLNVIGENYRDRCVDAENGTDNAHDAFGDWVLAELAACGYDAAQIEEQPFETESVYGEMVKGRNLVLTVPGRSDAGQIIVGAHYDGDGLGDNGSGAALLLATAASLVDVRPQFTVKYVFFDAEEVGLVGSRYFAGQLSDAEIASTLYMINLDSLAFGDFCNLYGGVYGDDYDAPYIEIVEGEPLPEPEHLEAYDLAADFAEALGFRVYRTADLDGYFEANGGGMAPEDGAFFTNPWTNAHPAPMNMLAPSPAAFGASDHAPFAARGIPYVCFEATNWWAKGVDDVFAYTGYVETYDETLGDGGQFMNTQYDTLENLNALFPGRAEQHYRMYSPLLSALLLVEAAEG